MVAYPLTPTPAWLAICNWQLTSHRTGIFYVGDTVTITLMSAISQGFTVGSAIQPVTGPTGYIVRDYYGNSVSTGSFASGAASFSPTPPSGGWLGWYRVYFTGPNTDANFGTSHGATNFIVIRNNPHFPPNPIAISQDGGLEGAAALDMVMKGVLGMGTSRLAGSTGSFTWASNLSALEANIPKAKAYWTAPGAQYLDPARPRALMSNMVSWSTDYLRIPGTPTGNYLTVYCQDGSVRGATTYVGISSGSISGDKLTVYSPNSSTVAETYDNLVNYAAAIAAINGISAYIYATPGPGISNRAAALSPTAIGSATWDGIVATVAAVYPDITHFEGPANEPGYGFGFGIAEKLFTQAVHAGAAGAKAIGPCVIPPITDGDFAAWNGYLDDHGLTYFDEISFHDYNFVLNDLNLGRSTIERFLASISARGISKPMWQTEAGGMFQSIFSVYHPRRARAWVLHTLLWEQYGLPRENNPYWYDQSHGFWAFAMFIESTQQALQPQCAIFRVLAEETWGQTHAQVLDFGTVGNRMFLGSVYQAPANASSTVVLMAASANGQTPWTVTLNVTGTTDPLTAVDAFGHLSTVEIIAEQAVVPVSELPTYVRCPADVTVSVFTCNDWPQVNVRGQGASSGSTAATQTVGSTGTTVLGDGKWMSDYANKVGVVNSSISPPDTATYVWANAVRVDRVIIWCGSTWQTLSALLDFDVQTTQDGVTWTTQETITNPTATSFLWGTDSWDMGTSRETYWDEQWIFDVKLSAPIVCKGVRLNVRSVSAGGEPDTACTAVGGQGGTPQLSLQEVAVLCDDNTFFRYATVS